MNKTLLAIRLVFIALCTAGGWLVCYTVREWDEYRVLATSIGFLIGVLVLLLDMLLKGFSLRGLSAITFGLAVGSLFAGDVGGLGVNATTDASEEQFRHECMDLLARALEEQRQDHEEHTGREILSQMHGLVDAFVAGYGTGGS